MKKIISLVLALSLLLTMAVAVAEGMTAGGDVDAWTAKVTKTVGEDVEPTADVIVVGAGGAGLAAASAAGEAGASVIVVEKAAAVGGNTILFGGIFNTEAKSFILEDGRVVGVNAVKSDGTKVTLHANKGVVLATGGFAGNVEMVVEYNTYWPDLTLEAKSDNTATATGDGIRMAIEIGANTVGMGFAQMLPTCTALDGQAGKGVGSQLYVNKEGLRYVNETSERDVLVKAAQAQTGGVFYGVGDTKMYNHRQQGEAKVADSVAKGYAFVGDTLEEAAEKAGIDAQQLVKTVEAFNSYVENECDPDFGRYGFMGKVEEGPFMIVAMAPALHHTMGGVEINTEAQVIHTDGHAIAGLYAAGEVCGGIHAGNRLGGNAITDIIVFGRIAGANAAAGK